MTNTTIYFTITATAALIITYLIYKLIILNNHLRNEVVKNILSINQQQTTTEQLSIALKRCEELTSKREEQMVKIASLESEKRALEDKFATEKEHFNTMMQQMRNEFKNLATEALEKNSQLFNKETTERLSHLLNPFSTDLKSFKNKVETFYGEENRQRFSLQETIKNLIVANQQISSDAINLTNALVGTKNNKFQGDWGETILEQILENSGLIKGEQWETQTTLRNENGVIAVNEDTSRNMKPDVIIHFPGGRDIIIDSKVSLKAYMNYLSAEEDNQRTQMLKEHLSSVKKHIDELSSKSYAKYNIKALDYVMLFIPNEPSYFSAMESDNSLWNYAYKKGIVLISPSNLISTLFVVNSLWTRERQQKDVQKIVDTANSIYDKFVGFTDNFTKIETALDKANEAYRDAYKQLTQGKGNITRRLEEIKRQGLLTTNKQIPDNYLND